MLRMDGIPQSTAADDEMNNIWNEGLIYVFRRHRRGSLAHIKRDFSISFLYY